MTAYNVYEILRTKFKNINKKIFVGLFNSSISEIADELRNYKKKISFSTTAGTATYLFDRENASSGNDDIDMKNILRIRTVFMKNSNDRYVEIPQIIGKPNVEVDE